MLKNLAGFPKVLALAAAGALALTACGGGSGSTPEASTAGLMKAGTLTVCSDIPYEPFEFVQDGKNVGFDMDMGAEIAKDLDAELSVITTGFEGIQSGVALNTGQCDLAISGISITDVRKTVMDFSDPYLDDDLGLLVAKDSGIKNLADLAGKEVGVQADTTGEAYALEKGLTTRQYQDTGLLISALESGQIQAAINNQSVLGFAAKGNENLTFAETYKTGEQLGMAVKKGNTDLLTAVNATLKRLTDDGTMDSLKTTWFGTETK